MQMIKKYWWIIAAIVLYMFMGKKKKTTRRRRPMTKMRRAYVRMSMMNRRRNPLGGYRSYVGASRRRSVSRIRRRR